jgi:Ca2+-binding RTX toxin-like protein
MDQSYTVNGGSGSGTIYTAFTASGSSYALSYVDTLVGAIDSILANGGNTDTVGPDTGSGSAYFPGNQLAGSEPIYQLVPDTTEVGSQTFDIATPGYVIDTIGGAVVVNTDSSGGDSILVEGITMSTTVNAAGSDNLVVFIDGNNVYNGSTVPGDMGDTVVGGTGNDTINTGTGNTTVNAGDGYDLIYLNDTGVGAYNDSAFLDAGRDSVVAMGTGDYVLATSEYETVTGGSGETSASNLTVVLLPNSDGTADGYDSITGGAGYLTVVDSSSDNSVYGGAGGLTFIGGAGITATINTGGGTALIFGNSGDNLSVGTTAGDTGVAAFVAGAGNETLNGAASTSNLVLFGASQADSASAYDTLIGGAGNDTLVAGSGTESLMGGAGSNTFLVDFYGSENANITIGDFLAGNDSVAFGHYSQADVQAALSAGQDINGNFVVTFTESSTTVTFTGVTSSSQLTGHIITF